MIINSERVHNNTFNEGIENYYLYQLSGDDKWLKEGIAKMKAANQMARNFGIVDQQAKLPHDEFVDSLFDTYPEVYEGDRSNAELMANRLKLMLFLQPAKFTDAQKTALQVFNLGEIILNNILEHRNDSTRDIDELINADLIRMRVEYREFAEAINAMVNYTNKLLVIFISLMVLLLIVALASISFLVSKSISNPIHEMVDRFALMAKGNLKAELSINSKNEIGELADSFRQIQDGIRQVIVYTKKVADGDYSSQITPRSEEDEMSLALNRMVDQLRETTARNQDETWLKTSINTLNAKLSGNQGLGAIGNISVSFLMEALHAQLGSVYWFDPDQNWIDAWYILFGFIFRLNC